MHEQKGIVVPWKDARVWLLPMILVAESLIIIGINGNSVLFTMANSPQAFPGDSFWLHVTVLGDSAILLTLLLPFVSRQPRLLWHIILAALLATIVVQLLKAGLGLPRPLSVLGSDLVHVIGPELSRKSFPSGHTAAIFTVLSVFWLRAMPITFTLPATLLAVLVAYSRMKVGAHWPLDVAGGMMIGWLAGVCGDRLGFRWQWGLSKNGQITVLAILFVAFLWVIIRTDTGHVATRIMQYSIAILSLLASLPGIKILLSRKIN